MKLTVFGGGGFIGSAISDRLLEDGHALRIVERPRVAPYRNFKAGEVVEWVTGDFSSTYDVANAIEGVDGVFHLISTTLPKNSNDDPIYDVQSNLVATLQLLNAMVAGNVRRIVFISSGGTVYGAPKYLPVDENHPTEPQVSYGITKLAIEKYLLMYGRLYGIRPTILRVANPYGERQRVETAQGAVGVFVQRALRGLPIEIWGDGSITRDYLHVSDVAYASAKAIAYTGEQSVFNIGSGSGTSLNQLIDLIQGVLGFPVVREYMNARSFDVPISVLCNDLAKRELGWTPKVGIEDGIARTARWLREEHLD